MSHSPLRRGIALAIAALALLPASASAKPQDLKVMVRNVYLGADIIKLATAADRAENLVTAVRATPLQLTDGTLLALSVSVGVAHAPQHATELRTLYAAADGALYEAKRAGRGRAVLAS